MSNNNLSVFNNEAFGNISVIMDKEQELWWFADEVCAILGLEDHRQSTRYLDEDEKGVFNKLTNGGPQNVTIINESGLWSLVIRSNKPELFNCINSLTSNGRIVVQTLLTVKGQEWLSKWVNTNWAELTMD